MSTNFRSMLIYFHSQFFDTFFDSEFITKSSWRKEVYEINSLNNSTVI